MITNSNFPAILNDLLTPDEITTALEGDGDYILLNIYIFNVGATASIESAQYCDQAEREATENGDLFCDKDSFLQLCTEVGYIIEGYND